MMMALTWLTVSTPFVYKAQQQLSKMEKAAASDTQTDEEDNGPLTNTTEEKNPRSINISEEYIHHTAEHIAPWQLASAKHCPYSVAEYIAYQGELFSPPPNA